MRARSDQRLAGVGTRWSSGSRVASQPRLPFWSGQAPVICGYVEIWASVCKYGVMSTAKLSSTLAALGLAALALAGCTATTAPQAVGTTPMPTVSATPTYLTELPAWAKEYKLWLVYPEGFKCSGTEGCPNDYRALIGEPGPVLPEGVEYYDPAKHECTFAAPAGVDCSKPRG